MVHATLALVASTHVFFVVVVSGFLRTGEGLCVCVYMLMHLCECICVSDDLMDDTLLPVRVAVRACERRMRRRMEVHVWWYIKEGSALYKIKELREIEYDVEVRNANVNVIREGGLFLLLVMECTWLLLIAC